MRGLLDWWNNLTQGARDGIIGTVIGGAFVSIALGILKLSCKSLTAGLRRLTNSGANGNQVPQPEPQRHEFVLKVESSQPLIEESKPEQPVAQPPPSRLLKKVS